MEALLEGSAALDWDHRSVRDDVVVLAGGPAVDTTEIDRIAREAIGAVDAAWRRPWARRVVVVAPADATQLAAVTGVGAHRPASAAMAITRPGLGAFVVLDPTAWSQATQRGRRALLIHETVHLAVDSGDARPPGATGASPAGAGESAWLREGFAQDVAYRAIGAQPRDIAPELLARIAREGPPERLPTASDLETTSRSEATQAARDDAYVLAWFAVRTLDRLGGPDAVRRSQESGTLELPGVTSQAFVRAWQFDLRAAAAESPR